MKYSDQEYIEYNPTNVFNSKLLPPPPLFQPTVFLCLFLPFHSIAMRTMLDYLCKGIFAYLPFSFIVANHCYYPPFNLLCRGATLELLDPLLVPSNPLGVLLNL